MECADRQRQDYPQTARPVKRSRSPRSRFWPRTAKGLSRFLSVTGLGPATLRAAAASPGFYGSVLGYLVADEPLLVMFAAEAGYRPEEIARAQAMFDGPPNFDGA